MTAARQVTSAVAQAITRAGCEALERYGTERLTARERALCAVGARQVVIEHAGLPEYLGQRTDEATQETREVFGRRLTLRLSLEVYAPRTLLAGGCAEATERVTQAMLTALPEGLTLQELRWDETRWDSASGMFRCGGEARYEAYFICEREEDETVFTDFVLRGTVKER